MRLLLAALLFVCLPASAEEVDFQVKRGSCAGGPDDRSDLSQAEVLWVGPDILQVAVWDTETQQRKVADGSGTATVKPGTVVLSYGTTFTPLPEDAPVVFCEDFVRVIFTVKGLPRAAYRVHLSNGEQEFSSSAEG